MHAAPTDFLRAAREIPVAVGAMLHIHAAYAAKGLCNPDDVETIPDGEHIVTAGAMEKLSGVGGVAFHDCLCLKLRMSSRQVTAIYDEHLAPVGIRITQFGVMAHLSEHGAAMAVVDLAAALRMDPTTLSRNLKPLEREGLLSIGRAAHHGRAKAITLSNAGTDLLQRAAPLWKMAHDRVSLLLGQRTAVTLAKGLDLSLEKLGDTRANGASADG